MHIRSMCMTCERKIFERPLCHNVSIPSTKRQIKRPTHNTIDPLQLGAGGSTVRPEESTYLEEPPSIKLKAIFAPIVRACENLYSGAATQEAVFSPSASAAGATEENLRNFWNILLKLRLNSFSKGMFRHCYSHKLFTGHGVFTDGPVQVALKFQKKSQSSKNSVLLVFENKKKKNRAPDWRRHFRTSTTSEFAPIVRVRDCLHVGTSHRRKYIAILC